MAGAVVGGVLDPIGQHLADRSRSEDERRRAEQQAGEAAGGVHSGGNPAVPAGPDGPDPTPGAGHPEAVHHLVPSGRSTGRTVGAGLVTAVLFGAAAAHFGRHTVLAPFCAFFAMLVAVSVTDLSHRLVPRRLVYGGTALIVPLLVAAAAADHRWHSLIGSAVAGAAAFAFFFAVWWFVPRGMGYGDVRLAGIIGLTVGYLSLLHAYVAFLVGFVVGMVFGLGLMALSSAGRKTRIPFAPSLAIGAVVAVLWGGSIAQSLFHAGH